MLLVVLKSLPNERLCLDSMIHSNNDVFKIERLVVHCSRKSESWSIHQLYWVWQKGLSLVSFSAADVWRCTIKMKKSNSLVWYHQNLYSIHMERRTILKSPFLRMAPIRLYWRPIHHNSAVLDHSKFCRARIRQVWPLSWSWRSNTYTSHLDIHRARCQQQQSMYILSISEQCALRKLSQFESKADSSAKTFRYWRVSCFFDVHLPLIYLLFSLFCSFKVARSQQCHNQIIYSHFPLNCTTTFATDFNCKISRIWHWHVRDCWSQPRIGYSKLFMYILIQTAF